MGAPLNMSLSMILSLFVLLQIKHLIMDWIWQTPFELKTKGIYNHYGGHQHSFKHAMATVLCFLCFITDINTLAIVFVIEYLLHYHIDWIKMNYGNSDIKNPKFWQHLGLDQMAHRICYIGYAYLLT